MVLVLAIRPEGSTAPLAQLSRDPRPPRFARLGRHVEEVELAVPRFTVDEHYTGPVPPRMVTFFRLNNNIDEDFLKSEVYSRVPGSKEPHEIEKIRVYSHEKRHLGLGKVTFRTVQLAKLCATELDGVSIMGSKIGAVIDPKADLLKRFQHKIIHQRLNPMSVTIDLVRDAADGEFVRFRSRGRHGSGGDKAAAAARRPSNSQLELLKELNKPELDEDGDDTPQSGDATPTEDEPVDQPDDVTVGGIVIRSIPTTNWSDHGTTIASRTEPDANLTQSPSRNDAGWESPGRNGHAKPYHKSYHSSPKRDGRYSDPAWDDSADNRRSKRWNDGQMDSYRNRGTGDNRGYRGSRPEEEYPDSRRGDSYADRNGDRSWKKEAERVPERVPERTPDRSAGPIITDNRTPQNKWKYKEPIYTQDQVTLHSLLTQSNLINSLLAY